MATEHNGLGIIRIQKTLSARYRRVCVGKTLRQRTKIRKNLFPRRRTDMLADVYTNNCSFESERDLQNQGFGVED
jgi:hypothetical protein